MTNAIGSVRIGNKRSGATRLKPGEIAIDIDRKNPVLGNPYVLNDHHDDTARPDVIARYTKDYEADLAQNGPMAYATRKLAERIKAGEHLVLMCWCSGAPTYKPCHGDRIATEINRIIKCE